MSCQIKVTANITNVQGIRRCLFPTEDSRGTDSWLQYCILSGSPTGEIIAIAHEKRLVILSAKWDTSTVLSQYNILFSGSVDNHDPITSVLCLPLVAQSQSSQVGPDWTCIVLGFESGYVRFYTENCNLLLEEQFHNEKVCSLKCQSQHHPRPDICPEIRPEEIYIHYNSNVCLINGPQLFPTLRNNRSQLARVQAKGSTLEPSTSSIFPKKWGFVDQATINDAAVVGLDLSNSFDHLFTASTCGGFETRYRAMPPHNSLVLGAGAKPYVGFHYAVEGGAQPVLSDVAKAVASKLKSALPGWLTGGKLQNVDKQPSVTIQPAEAMGCRFGLCDLRRQANTIILSPDRRLAVVTDALGRVALIDARKGITLRLLKGYRESQCAFIQVPDEKKPKHRMDLRLALFLIVYSPKKGTIEIFTAQQCSKIATFTASKHGRLLYTNYGLLGFSTTISKSKYSCHFTCSLFDPDGTIKEFVIPFHYALTEKNSKQARDLHLLKRLKQFMKSGDYGNEKLSAEISNTCSEIKTNHVRLQLLEMLITHKYVTSEIILKVVMLFQEKLDLQDQSVEPESDCKTLTSLCYNLNLLLNFYMFFESESLDAENGNLDAENGNLAAQPKAETRLKIGEKDMNNLQRLLDLSTLSDNKKNASPKVSFFEQKKSSICEILSAFNLTRFNENLWLKNNLDESVLFKASEVIFEKYITQTLTSFDDFKTQIVKSTINVQDLLKMALCYWVNRSLNSTINLETEMHTLSDILYNICQVADLDSICVEYNKVNPFWSHVREILADSSRPFPALTAAVLCKGVAQRIEQDREMQQNSVTSLDDEINMEIWEKLSQDNCEWGMLIGKLEDVSLLNIILSNKPLTDAAVLPKLTFDKIDISLKYILGKGKGSVSELVAQWLTTGGVDPQEISVNELLHQQDVSNFSKQEGSSRPQSLHLQNTLDSQRQSLESNDVDLNNVDNEIAIQPVFEHLNIIKKQFPYSLETSVLLSNMCWEYSLAWQKDISQFQKLDAAIRCLQYIRNLHVKQGMFNLMWSTHLKHLFESSCKLINKVGKVPKERLCRQDTGMSDLQIAVFIETCTNFLDMFMDVVQQSFNTEKLDLHYEAIWDNGGIPLSELAQQQSQVNYDLLHLHYQLSLMMQMMTVFSVKHTKAMSNLFHNFVVGLFFTDLQQPATINLHNCDTKLISNRTQFLVKVISASIETVTLDGDAIYSTDHVMWMSKCLALARVWNVDTDALRRYQVLQLFSSGFDSLAAELLASVADTDRIGPDLLALAGKRLSQFVSKSTDLGENLSALSPPLTAYLDGLSGDWCAPSTITNIISITTHAIRCFNENQTEFRLATLLLDACATLADMDDTNPNLSGLKFMFQNTHPVSKHDKPNGN